ncbi:MAG: 2-amino-4-hydroxy-6-hydroxymethyldihydropteridine diphosphokinase [Candidatus Dadabacteria bacterium]|nr:2-amino-4-hydroxy-6-hydroxymethyldihydropteridine diphosphokinase [Candidatus Dadabacteria bacterium]NIS08725.1 2-amino-4-hydroxy-6-hydroxymethyldihydropteridine diphosphokinase [Candidatus Dadabacteria bacterium]NIV42609.1 2-amino-4-hydroxy-6-hydroxymethyldihydropteridine diphosphokinase [Candidatus Dadabacteria bacterium]NIX15411.1 2-amino-4-hydroxy-6-hydroxymethyldihydropteridine diphosphokinase [Candidatus Dadabacteria bacterium]NIY22074.1 2-amino-4-hydroxy-6-hydroxymethyldihydropteridin
MNIVYLSLGSNIENRIEHCIKALDELSTYVEIEEVSSFYETEAIGVSTPSDFINCAAKILTPLKPVDLLDSLTQTEKKLGRESKGDYSPRTIDIDIIFYNDLILQSDNLTIPHKQAHLRRFVIEPLSEICPDLIHPLLNKTLLEIIQSMKNKQYVKKIGSFYQ